jgi:hypothetical protein
LRLGDHDDAIMYARRGIETSDAVRDEINVADCLLIAGAVHASRGDPQRAARLVGLAEKTRNKLGGTLDPAERELHDETLGSIRSQLGEESFAACWEQGQAMSLPDALAQAHEV